MDKYYLMGNIIDPKKYWTFLPEEIDYCNYHEVYTFLEEGILNAVRSKSHSILAEFIRSVVALTDMLRGRDYYDEFLFFWRFYKRITTLDYHSRKLQLDESHKRFIEEHDFTEVYYTLGKLYAGRNDINRYLHYIELADNEYAKNNDMTRGEFIRYLLESNSLSLWYITSDILSAFSNYKNMNRHSSDFEIALKSIDVNINKETILKLLKDFEYDLLIQFIHTEMSIDSFEKGVNSKEDNTNYDMNYRSIKQMRYVGELTWLYEIYLKDRMRVIEGRTIENTLGGVIIKLVDKLDLKTEYMNLKDKYENNYASKTELNTLGLRTLIEDLMNTPVLNARTNNTEIDSISFTGLFIKSLYALLLYRNYYTHNMDRDTNFGRYFSSYNTIRVLIFTVFLSTMKLFDTNFNMSIIHGN